MSDSIYHKLFLLLESTYGTTPASNPAFTRVRHSECDLNLTRPANNSAEITGDGHIRNSRLGPKAVAGGFNFELTFGGAFDVLLEALLRGTWTSDVLKVGSTRKSFSMLRHFTDLASGDKPYHLFNGCEPNTLELTIPAEGVITGTFGFVGRDRSLLGDLTSLGVPTFGSPSVLDAFDGFTGTFTEGGSGLGTVTELSLSYTNGLAPRVTVASGGVTILPADGQKSLSGNLTVHFEDASLIEKFMGETESGIVFTPADPAGNTYQFNIPRLKYNDAPIPTNAAGPLTIALPFQALFSEGSDLSPLIVTRTAV